jgi:molecular chaperone DnaK (HSP70)
MLSDDDIDSYFNQQTTELTEASNITSTTVIGIDLGTTNTCVGIWRNNNLEIIPDKDGNRTIPSVVAFTNSRTYIGREAKNQIELNPENTIYEVKRLIGRNSDDETVLNDKEFLTYDIIDNNNNIVIKTNTKQSKNLYTPEEISAKILMEAKNMVTSYLGHQITKTVITVPAYFNDAQRQATKDAAVIAGLDCIRIINEPTAAALAYGLEKLSKNKDDDMNIIVYDLGGGTLDVSLLNISDGLFQVLGCTGNTHTGGIDFDNQLYNHCINKFKSVNNLTELSDLRLISVQKLRKSCENAKKVLSETWKANIVVKDFYNGLNLLIQITRTEFEQLCRDLLILCLKPVEDVLTSCDMEREMIDEIILVGGATRMPAIRENLKLFFRGKEPNSSINPDEVVAAGAAIQGYIIENSSDPFSENIVLLDIIPLSLGVETIGGVMNVLIPRNTVIPVSKKRKYTTDADNETSVIIKIFEGERCLTKDNFCVGEFTLKGLEPAPKGVPQIEISFNVDRNGIINVLAEDLKNNQNKNSITISGNKGRLSPDDIALLVKEAQESELRDKVELEKKQLFHEIEDLCSNITFNIKNNNYKIADTDKTDILDDVDSIINWLAEQEYDKRSAREYITVLDRIKKQYGTLMLRINTDDSSNPVSANKSVEGTGIFEDDLENELDNEYNFDITDKEAKKELIQLRDTLMDLCKSVLEVLSNSYVKIDATHIDEMKDYVDDVMLWVIIQEKISKVDYVTKIDEVNKICSELVEKYDATSIFEPVLSKKAELEQLCYTLLSNILSNAFSIQEELIVELKEEVQRSLDWLIDIEVLHHKAEIEGEEFVTDEDEIQQRINCINELCDNIYNSMIKP